MSRRSVTGAVLTVCTALLIASCSTTVPGKPVSVFDDPFSVAGMPAVDGPSGLRPGAKEPSRDVVNGDGGDIDNLAASSASDVEDFWSGGAYRDAFDDSFTPAKDLISWDADGPEAQQFCEQDTFGLDNAGYCTIDHTIGWDRGEMVPQLENDFGDIAVTYVLAHEYGHAVQRQARLNKAGTPTLVKEQQADCFAGSYMRWVAEGNSDRFTLSTGDGLNRLLAAVISFRDPVLDDSTKANDQKHGTAFDRVSAFQFGFTDGATACATIDEKEIVQRRGDLPVELQRDQTGEWPVSEKSVKAIVEALGTQFSPADPPKLDLDTYAAKNDCQDARPSPPVSYCPATNTIAVDMGKLKDVGALTGQEPNNGPVSGSNTAYSVLVSRYMLALQHQRGLQLDTAEAALRTACLTGVATAKMAKPIVTSDGHTAALTAGDVDEAVSGLLTNGLAASDVNGETVPSGFSRIDAFRNGVLGDKDRCFKRFP
jgi:predicted metalloprotease